MGVDLVPIVEVAYATPPTQREWLQGMADAVHACLGRGMGAQAYLYDFGDSAEFRVLEFAAAGDTPVDRAAVEAMTHGNHPTAVLGLYRPGVAAPASRVVAELERSLRLPLRAGLAATWKEYGIGDVLGISGGDPSMVGCMVTIPSPELIRLAPALRRTLVQVGAHLASGYRLQRAVATREADAVLDSKGKLESATPEAQARRASLARHVERRAAAIGPLRRQDPARAIEMWKALVDGEWSIVDHVDTDGKRVLVARKNRPDVGKPGALTLRERQVVAYATLGHAIKLIAYELGIPAPAASACLARALRKLGLQHRSQLAAFRVGGEEPGDAEEA